MDAERRLARCLREVSLPQSEFLSRWLPEFFTGNASIDLKNEMAAIVSDFHPAGFRLMATTLAVNDTTAYLPDFTVPTLLIWGDDDSRSPIEIAFKFRDAMPDAVLEVLAGAGHVSNMEDPEAFNAAVRSFCLSHT